MPIKNEVGNRYGRLLVLERAENDSKGNAYWICRCDCGNITKVRGTQLRYKTRSCGCLQKEKIKQIGLNNFKNLTGKRFGKLEVLEESYRKGGYVFWKCKCDCGNIINVKSVYLLNGDTQSCGCLKSKSESILQQFFDKNEITYCKEFSFPDLYDKRSLRFDFAIFNRQNNLSCLIEYQGIQHYDKNNGYFNEAMVQHDFQKEQYCKNHNIPLIYFYYNEVLTDELIEDRLIPIYNFKAN